MAKLNGKQLFALIFSIVAISAAGVAIYQQTRPPGINRALHTEIGVVLADQVGALTNSGRVVLITLAGDNFPELKAQAEGFEKGLEKFPKLKFYRTVEVDGEGKAKYGPGRGLSDDRYLRILKKYEDRAVAIVSLIGAPELDKDKFEKLPKKSSFFIAETREREELVLLFAAGGIHAAIVPRFDFPSPVDKPHTPREWFDKFWQVINVSNFKADTEPEAELSPTTNTVVTGSTSPNP
jgi:hypothetical protein